MKSFRAIALKTFPLMKAGDDLARIIVERTRNEGLELEDGDVIVVAQKVFSKAENRVVRLSDVAPTRRAVRLAKITHKSAKFVELVLRETKKILKASREVLLVEDKRGLVCINAGIDKSNVDGKGVFALLPEDPDQSAEKCRRTLAKITGKKVAVIVSDTYSRPFRRGQVNFAIGVSGINPFRDYRGKPDIFGQILKVKNVAVADEMAAAAELLMGQADEATPVVILRGLSGYLEHCEKCSARELGISRRQDLFRHSL